jgi:uncharacterized protein YerC
MDDWRTNDVNELISALLRLETEDEAAAFLRDLCTLGELHDLGQGGGGGGGRRGGGG